MPKQAGSCRSTARRSEAKPSASPRRPPVGLSPSTPALFFNAPRSRLGRCGQPTSCVCMQTLGNRAVEFLLNGLVSSPPMIQAKLTVNAPGDEYEREADRMAEQVMRMPAVPRAVLDEEEHENAKPEVMTGPQPSPEAGGAFAVRKAFERPLPSALREEFETKPEVMTGPQPSPEAGGAFAVRKAFERQLNAARGQGLPLPPALREDFETKFGADFSRVRVHADAQSDQLNRSIEAQAFTTGQDVFFRRGGI